MQIIDKSIDELIPYCNNSRTHDESQILQIASSIKEFGFTNPVLIDEDNGIIAGHGRVLAARKLGINKVPSIKLSHLTDIQKKAYIIADNKIALNAGWDEELLKNEVEQLIANDFDIDLIGFSDEEIDSLLGEEEEASHGLADKDSVPEVPEDPITKPGDVWIMGEHRLMCGDGTSVDEVGIDVGFKVAQILEKTYGARMKVNEILQQVYEKKWLGKKVGKGFYIHDDKKKTRKPNPELNELLANKKPTTDRRDVLDRMVLLMINEAAMILEEGVAMRAEDIDIGMIFGTGFPPFRGGLLKYADDLGVTNIIKRLEELSLKYGNRFLPAKILLQYSKENKKFIN
jgi:ParB-like chromosome segregation protein Spo0J